MKTNLFVLYFFCLFSATYAQVGIGTTDPKTTLDVRGNPTDASSLDGITAPRMTGDQLAAKTYTSYQQGALVYVTAAATNPTGQTTDITAEGLYVFSSNLNKWIALKSSTTGGTGWALTGNSGTDPSTDFLGTTDNQPLNFRVNNIPVGSIKTDNSLQLGRTATASGARSTSIGFESTASADESAAFGRASAATGARSTAVGFESRAQADESAAYGRGANASAARSTAIGFETTATADDATALGRNADASAARSTATGFNALASNTDANAYGSGARATAVNSVALGTNARSGGQSSVALGLNSIARNQSSMAMGDGADASGNNALSIGVGASSTGQNSFALGSTSSASEQSATAIGQNSNASGVRSLALGNGARASGLNATAVGYNSNATQDNTVILGNNANVGVGTSAPTAKLQVNGTFRYVDASPGDDNGKVLTSDANGNASWQSFSAPSQQIMMRKLSFSGSGDPYGTTTLPINFNFEHEVFDNITGSNYDTSNDRIYLPVGVYKIESHLTPSAKLYFDWILRINGTPDYANSTIGTAIAATANQNFGPADQVAIIEISNTTDYIDFQLISGRANGNTTFSAYDNQSYLKITRVQ